MSTRPLTTTQAELLEALKSGVKVHYMAYMGSLNPQAYYFRADNYKRCTAAAKALLKRGLAEKYAHDNTGHKLRIKQ